MIIEKQIQNLRDSIIIYICILIVIGLFRILSVIFNILQFLRINDQIIIS